MTRILDVLKLAEKLKYELRHSWLSNGRQESVAEHTWRVSLMAILISPYLKMKSVNMEKLLKMIIIHDLIEAEAGDVPAFDALNKEEIRALKLQKEKAAIENLKTLIGGTVGEEIYQLFFEFEEKQTFEAKVANALDKLEAQIQHNEADITTWIEIEQDMCFLMDKHVSFDTFFLELKNAIEHHAQQKLAEAGFNVEEIKTRVKSGGLMKEATGK
ncbi:HD domain-containing protein [Sutcliffiella deserti]|uniref:HD domain-containing protein n=1 Tax=Sutcliffiella deserti TaxID=2875501 RepID=UPI001CBD6255|nr:HD domain-containing protein [Sutcliffiella deserti]